MASGKNKVLSYQSRLRDVNGRLEVFCKHCGAWKSGDDFHKSKGLYKSMCKSCHNSRYGKEAGYESPSRKLKKKQAEERKQAWLSEKLTCTICGEVRERRDFYSEAQGRYLQHCCGQRRSHEQIEKDISEQMKTCFECGLRLPFDEFSYSPNGRDKKRPYCKCCVSAIAHEKSDNPNRQKWIEETSDGSITTQSLSKMLREAEDCSHCGVKLTQSYPVKPTQKTIDHNTPLSRGGKHVLSNISVMCLGCNSSKQDRTVEEFSIVKKKIAP
jgi:hypothetical protein